MKKRDKVQTVRKPAPVKTFLAHWGIFLSLLCVAQLGGYVVVYPTPVSLVEAEQGGGNWLSTITR